MKGVKFSGFFAACGFLLSFLFGLFSHTAILTVLLKAFIFGIIFGILGFGISVVFEKFLNDDSVDFSSDVTSGDSAPTGGVSASEGNTASKGQVVDITIQDEALPQSESENHFMVGDNHQMLNDSDLQRKSNTGSAENGAAQTVQAVQAVQSEDNGFVPLKNFETLRDLSGKEAVSPDSMSHAEVMRENTSAMGGGIDTLPDMNNLVIEDNGSSDNQDDTDTSFDSVTTSIQSSNKEPPEIKDAGLMAKAISSILSDENSL